VLRGRSAGPFGPPFWLLVYVSGIHDRGSVWELAKEKLFAV
jgi:hypothetical protein